MFSLEEILIVAILGSSLLGLLIHALKKGGNRLWEPLTIISASYFYYFIVGPVINISFDRTTLAGVEARHLAMNAWIAGSIGFMFLVLGYQWRCTVISELVARAMSRPSAPSLVLASVLGVIATFSAISWMISADVPLYFLLPGANSAGATVEASNYILLALTNLYIVSLVLAARSRQVSRLIFIPYLLFVISFYLISGTRIRIFILLVALLVVSELGRKANTRLWKISLFAVSMIVLMAVIGSFRVRYGGLDLTIERSFIDVVLWPFNEAQVFLLLGQVIDGVPRPRDYLYLEPLIQIFYAIVPRSIWPAKPELAEQLEILPMLVGGQEAYGAGFAGLHISDYYLILGWPSLVLGAFLFGLIGRLSWDIYLRSNRSELMTSLYAVFFPFLYYAISRGYLAQVLVDFAFTLLMPAVIAGFLRLAIGRQIHTKSVQDVMQFRS